MSPKSAHFVIRKIDQKATWVHSLKMSFTTIILAAGKGTRMKSPLAKVLHKVAGQTLLTSVFEEFKSLGSDDIRVVISPSGDDIKSSLQEKEVQFYTQQKPIGTANAVASAIDESLEPVVVIANGDHPLLETNDLKDVITSFKRNSASLCVLSCKIKNPGHFGRIVRSGKRFKKIVEFLEATKEQKKINEINTGIYLVKADVLKKYLPLIKNKNSKKEFYLTDIIQLCVEDGLKIEASPVHPRVAFGVNNQKQLSVASLYKYKRNIEKHMENGVSFEDPGSCYIDTGVAIEAGAIIEPGVRLSGQSKIGKLTVIKQGSSVENSTVGEKCVIGPYARLRGGCNIADHCEIGNFVELKNAKFKQKSKAKHLTYIGDAEVGEETNIGCGVITCNYAVDRKKYKTIIGDRVFVGSDVQFVAPVEVDSDSYIASGSTITKKVGSGDLAIARGRQKNLKNYKPK